MWCIWYVRHLQFEYEVMEYKNLFVLNVQIFVFKSEGQIHTNGITLNAYGKIAHENDHLKILAITEVS